MKRCAQAGRGALFEPRTGDHTGSSLKPIHWAALQFVGDRRIDRASGRAVAVDLRAIGEPMRQVVIDLAMMEPPLVDVEGDSLFLTPDGFAELARSKNPAGAREVDLADVFGYGPSAPGWLEPKG